MKKLCEACYLRGYCALAFATVPSMETISAAGVRLTLQNYLADLYNDINKFSKDPSYEDLLDFLINTQRDFLGRYRNQKGHQVLPPQIDCWLNPGAVFWLRDQVCNGKWSGADEVPRLRKESKPRWQFVYMIMSITENIQPACPQP